MKLIKTIKPKSETNKENKTNKIAILSCVHGDESYSLKIFKKLKHIKPKNCKIDFYLVNEEAYIQKKRFIETDLNRSFNIDNTHEANLAKQIKEKLKNYDYIIDLHSTTSKNKPCLITTNKDHIKNIKHTNFIKSFQINKIIYIEDKEKYSLISQFKNAISIEISSNNYKSAIKNGKKCIKNFLKNNNYIPTSKNNNLQQITTKNFKIQTYKIIGKNLNTQKNKKSYKNFKLYYENKEFFYPLMSGEKSYDFNGFKVRKTYQTSQTITNNNK